MVNFVQTTYFLESDRKKIWTKKLAGNSNFFPNRLYTTWIFICSTYRIGPWVGANTLGHDREQRHSKYQKIGGKRTLSKRRKKNRENTYFKSGRLEKQLSHNEISTSINFFFESHHIDGITFSFWMPMGISWKIFIIRSSN